jgi:hypothetical protein
MSNTNTVEEHEALFYCSGKSEAIAAAKNIAAKRGGVVHVVYFPNAVPRRCQVVTEEHYQAEYAGQDWAQLILTVRN